MLPLPTTRGAMVPLWEREYAVRDLKFSHRRSINPSYSDGGKSKIWHEVQSLGTVTCPYLCFYCNKNSSVGEVVHLSMQIILLNSARLSTDVFMVSSVPIGPPYGLFWTWLVFTYLNIVIWVLSGTFPGPHNFILLFALRAVRITLS